MIQKRREIHLIQKRKNAFVQQDMRNTFDPKETRNTFDSKETECICPTRENTFAKSKTVKNSQKTVKKQSKNILCQTKPSRSWGSLVLPYVSAKPFAARATVFHCRSSRAVDNPWASKERAWQTLGSSVWSVGSDRGAMIGK